MTEFKEEHHVELRKFSSGPIKNEVLTVNSEHPSSADHFERKFQAKIYPSDQSFEKQEEDLIYFKEEHHDELRKSSSVLIQNEVPTLTSKHPSSADHFESKFQYKISPSYQRFEQSEEYSTPFVKYLEELINIQEFKEKYHDVLRNSSSGLIQK